MIGMRHPWKRRLAIVADWILGRLALLLTAGRRTASLPAHPRILLIRCDHIGDAVMATTVLRPLRDALQPVRLDVLAGPWAAPIFRHHSAVDEVIEYAAPWWAGARGLSRTTRFRAWLRLPGLVRRIRARRYDIAIDLRGDLRHIFFFMALGRVPERVGSDRTGGAALLTRTWRHAPGLHQVEANAAIVGQLGAAGELRLDVPVPETLSEGIREQLLKAQGPNGFLALALQGSAPNRSWPVMHAAELATAAHERFGVATVYVGGMAEREFGEELRRTSRAPVVNLAGQTSLDDALSIFARAQVCVTVDSGPMHLAAASGTSVVALFGPGDPCHSRPWSSRVRIVTVGAPCGCIHPSCDYAIGPGRCMVGLTPGAVVDAVEEVLGVTWPGS